MVHQHSMYIQDVFNTFQAQIYLLLITTVNCFTHFMSCIELLMTLKQNSTYWRNVTERFFFPKLLNNPLHSCSLIYFDFSLLHTVHFDKSIILPFFPCNFLIFTFCIFSTLKTIWKHCLINRLKSLMNYLSL